MKKKILTISFFTPASENIRGISALIYTLIKHRPTNVDIRLLTYNANNLNRTKIEAVKKELNIDIEVLEFPKWINLLRRINIFRKLSNFILQSDLYTYIPFPTKVKKTLNQYSPDAIWLYPFYFYKWTFYLKGYPIVLTGCDSNALFKNRCMEDGYFNSMLRRFKLKRDYHKCLYVEKEIAKTHAHFHLVGKADFDFYKSHTFANNAFYLPHPHYLYQDKEIKFKTKKLKILWAGANDYYMETKGKELKDMLLRSSNKLSDKISLYFLGKGWDKYCLELNQSGYQACLLGWVDNYIHEIQKYDIQIVPISVGTGTKGKVLDAMSNGLLCIGTPYAMENISNIDNGYIMYEDVDKLCDILCDCFENREKYEEVAQRGRNSILKEHNPHAIALEFFNKFD